MFCPLLHLGNIGISREIEIKYQKNAFQGVQTIPNGIDQKY